MKIKTAEQYLARYRRRGEKARSRWAHDYINAVVGRTAARNVVRVGEGSKPNHADRTVDIAKCFEGVGSIKTSDQIDAETQVRYGKGNTNKMGSQ